jgi:hypothetical protein
MTTGQRVTNAVAVFKCCNSVLNVYPWLCMPVTVHNILVHSPDIIKSCILHTDRVSETLQEACSIDCRRCGRGRTRKASVIASNENILFMLSVSSDTVISCLWKLSQRKAEIHILNFWTCFWTHQHMSLLCYKVTCTLLTFSLFLFIFIFCNIVHINITLHFGGYTRKIFMKNTQARCLCIVYYRYCCN